LKSAANGNQQPCNLDRQAVIKKVPEKVKRFLKEADAASS
jgi:hypothetical protein